MRAVRARASILLSSLLAVVGFGTPASAQDSAAPAIRTGAVQMVIGGRVQTQLNTTTVDSMPPSEWIIRRVRLDVRVRMNDLVSARLIPDFSESRLSLKDAYVRFDFDPALGVLVGQTKRPFSLIELTSSTLMLPIERGVRIRGVDGVDQLGLIDRLDYSARDMGLHLIGEPAGAPMGLTYAVAVLGGPLKGRVGGRETHQFAARATVEPVTPLRLGVGWSSRDFARPDLVPPSHDLRRGHAFGLDVEYGNFAPGIHVMGEITGGDYDPFLVDRFLGAQGLAGYRTGAFGGWVTGIEPLIRLSHASIDTARPQVSELGGTLVTPGVNVYFGPLNRLMINYDHWSPDGPAPAQGSFKASVQAVF